MPGGLWYDELLTVGGAFTFTNSTTKLAYASRPSASQPTAGNNLKNRLVAFESRALEASSKDCRKMRSNLSLAACRVCIGGRWISAVGFVKLGGCGKYKEKWKHERRHSPRKDQR